MIAGKAHAMRQMENFLRGKDPAKCSLAEALKLAAAAWAAGHMALSDDREGEVPAMDRLRAHLHEQLAATSVEAAVMEVKAPVAVTYRSLAEGEARAMIS